ncbi:hypothetical protein JW906_09955 [bacterium]|nr:hypothetical protein [bacterium]
MAQTKQTSSPRRNIAPFDRETYGGSEAFTFLGKGEWGGKTEGLAFIQENIIPRLDARSFPSISVHIPNLAVITTHFFDLFLENNGLQDTARSEENDERIAHRFQKAELPPDLIGDLRALISKTHCPLAVRSSSLLEDQAHSPFAGIYETKMIPNNQPDPDSRFNRLVEAVKFVYASTFFRKAKAYAKSVNQCIENEKMAVIIQEIAGRRHGERFYPDISGVARSCNFFPFGHAAFEDGVVNLALGLGKTIVDGSPSWFYSPAYPDADPPRNTVQDLMNQTQTEFWAVNMGRPPAYDPVRETEYLVKCGLQDADYDNTLSLVASTYDAQNDRIVAGTAPAGPRIINFAPILKTGMIPLNGLLKSVIGLCEEASGGRVEIEFAVTFDRPSGPSGALSLLQVRPIALNEESLSITGSDLSGEHVLLASERVLGCGLIETIRDIVYVRPETFDMSRSRELAGQIGRLNSPLAEAGRPYLLIGFGRWGTSDPWMGIPVAWDQISGAKVIVESPLPGMNLDPSQGYHFFHNLSNLGIGFFSLDHRDALRIDWDWLDRQSPAVDTGEVRHVRLESCLTVKLNARERLGVILK